METLILKLTKFMMVSVFLLAIISFGAVSAASDTTADDAVGVTDDVEIASPDVGEINTDGDDVAIGDVNDDSKLGASDDEKLSAGTVTPKYTIDVTPNVMSGSTYVAQYGQVITVNGTFENATGNVTIKFGYSGNFQTFEKTLVDGKFSQDITNYTVRNNYQISVNYKGDDYYKTASWSKNIHVKLDDVVAGNADYGQMAYIMQPVMLILLLIVKHIPENWKMVLLPRNLKITLWVKIQSLFTMKVMINLIHWKKLFLSPLRQILMNLQYIIISLPLLVHI